MCRVLAVLLDDMQQRPSINGLGEGFKYLSV